MDAPPQIPVNRFAFAGKSLAILVFAALVAFVSDYKLKLGTVPGVILALSIFGVGVDA